MWEPMSLVQPLKAQPVLLPTAPTFKNIAMATTPTIAPLTADFTNGIKPCAEAPLSEPKVSAWLAGTYPLTTNTPL